MSTVSDSGKEPARLAGQVALVTGGGRGIGRAVALALASEGAKVVVSARTPAEVEAVASEIRDAGGTALGIAADVQRIVDRTRADYGDIGILVTAAGGTPSELYEQPGVVGGREGMLAAPWNMAESTWDTFIDTNLKSVFLCTKAVIPRMVAAGRGDVVTIASQMGRVTAKMGGAYAVAKTGVIALTELFASAAARHGVRVNAVSPGLVDTPGQRRLVAALGVPLPNYDSADSVAKAVLYILCDAPKSMNGQSLDTFGI